MQHYIYKQKYKIPSCSPKSKKHIFIFQQHQSPVAFFVISDMTRPVVACRRPCAHHSPREQHRHLRFGSAVAGRFQCHDRRGDGHCGDGGEGGGRGHGGHNGVTWKKTRDGKNMGKHGKTHIKTQYMEISIVMGDPLYRWMVFVMENAIYRWMRTRAIPMDWKPLYCGGVWILFISVDCQYCWWDLWNLLGIVVKFDFCSSVLIVNIVDEICETCSVLWWSLNFVHQCWLSILLMRFVKPARYCGEVWILFISVDCQYCWWDLWNLLGIVVKFEFCSSVLIVNIVDEICETCSVLWWSLNFVHQCWLSILLMRFVKPARYCGEVWFLFISVDCQYCWWDLWNLLGIVVKFEFCSSVLIVNIVDEICETCSVLWWSLNFVHQCWLSILLMRFVKPARYCGEVWILFISVDCQYCWWDLWNLLRIVVEFEFCSSVLIVNIVDEICETCSVLWWSLNFVHQCWLSILLMRFVKPARYCGEVWILFISVDCHYCWWDLWNLLGIVVKFEFCSSVLIVNIVDEICETCSVYCK